MTRRVPLLPIASADSEPKFSITDNDWEKIQKSYGHELIPEVRQLIQQVSTQFVRFEIFEQKAERLQPALDAVSSVQDAVIALQNALCSIAGASDTMVYAARLIKSNFDDTCFLKARHRGDDLISTLRNVSASLNFACSIAKQEMENGNIQNYREGEHWDMWINRLTKIAKEKRLPHGVSKDSDKSSRVSPFISLVKALHEHVPEGARRHCHSDVALAKAITDARRENGTRISKTPLKKVPPTAKRSV